jgi:hypothetical protein
MPLDRQHVPNPANLIETFLAMMVKKIQKSFRKRSFFFFLFQSGQFLPDNEVLRKTMKVKTPALTEAEVAVYGPVIAGTCPKEIKTYRLVPKTAEEMKSKFIFLVDFYLIFI